MPLRRVSSIISLYLSISYRPGQGKVDVFEGGKRGDAGRTKARTLDAKSAGRNNACFACADECGVSDGSFRRATRS
jgi:hypothetical protein